MNTYTTLHTDIYYKTDTKTCTHENLPGVIDVVPVVVDVIVHIEVNHGAIIFIQTRCGPLVSMSAQAVVDGSQQWEPGTFMQFMFYSITNVATARKDILHTYNTAPSLVNHTASSIPK